MTLLSSNNICITPALREAVKPATRALVLTPVELAALPAAERFALAGGKAAALAEVHDAALAVPDWFVVTTAALRACLSSSQATALEAAWQRHNGLELRMLMARLRPNLVPMDALEPALQRLCTAGERLAVRSSAQLEDGARRSFAGQYVSLLDVQPHNVAEAVLEVWRSAFSERVMAYLNADSSVGNALTIWQAVPAVIIQRMVHPRAAGVAFSANPTDGRRSVALVAAVAGCAQRLVDGELSGDSYRVGRDGTIITRHPAGALPLLSDEEVGAIAALARQVARLRGTPQDIEWALADGRLWLLQARPITTLAAMADPDGERRIWDNSNVGESYSGVTTPLTFSFARRAYAAVYAQFCRLMGVPAAVIDRQQAMFARMIGLIEGRIYYNLLNWYRLVALLPGYRFNRRFMEQMMGVHTELAAEEAEAQRLPTKGARIRDGVALLGSGFGIVRAYLNLPAQITRFEARLQTALATQPGELDELRLDELTAYYRELEAQLLTRWDAPIVNDFLTMIWYGLLRKLATSWCADTDGRLANALLCAEGAIISAEPARLMRKLAAHARNDPALIAALCHKPLPIIEQAIVAAPAFARSYQAYLERFGERCIDELKLESATLHDDPLPLLRSVGRLAAQPEKPLPATAALHEEALERALAALRGRPVQRLIFNWVLGNARRGVRNRENLRFARTLVFGRARRIFRELGRRFRELGLLADADDIFYLEVDEILGYSEGSATCGDLAGLAVLRKRAFAAYRAASPPPGRIESRGSVYQGRQAAIAPDHANAVQLDDQSRRGTGCCPGLVRGRVRVVSDPRAITLEPGEILVAARTDPGWIVLFPVAAGLLVERGSLLSHAAIVARELGLPTVVGLDGVTNWLADGDLVELDGASGVVRRIAER